jgi:5-methylcytosine-specific restriction endonuclease McrA
MDKKKWSRVLAESHRDDVVIRQRGFCAACNEDMGFMAEIHHIKRVSDDGGGHPDNLIAVCPNCHTIITKLGSKAMLFHGNSIKRWIVNKYGGEYFQRVCELAKKGWK